MFSAVDSENKRVGNFPITLQRKPKTGKMP